MKKSLIYFSIVPCLIFLACSNGSQTEVRYSGALHSLMSGELEGTIDLDTLSQKQNLYALGAVENLKGEIQIFSGKPYNSQKQNDKLVISNSFKTKASLLVYANVSDWIEIKVPPSIIDKNKFEEYVFQTAKEFGVNTEQPFPFLLEGQIKSLEWHVIDWPKADKVHTHQKHKESGANGKLQEATVEILGFFSTKHKAVFTHHTTNMHLHFKTSDEKLAGHVDNLMLGDQMILKLPRK